MMQLSCIIVETGETREVHHFAALIGYGVDAIYPYLAFETYKQAVSEGSLSISYEETVNKYVRSLTEGIVKVMSKMGISTIQSYRGEGRTRKRQWSRQPRIKVLRASANCLFTSNFLSSITLNY